MGAAWFRRGWFPASVSPRVGKISIDPPLVRGMGSLMGLDVLDPLLMFSVIYRPRHFVVILV